MASTRQGSWMTPSASADSTQQASGFSDTCRWMRLRHDAMCLPVLFQRWMRTLHCSMSVAIFATRAIPLRSKANHFSIGSPSALPLNQLPTTRDVVNYVRLLEGEAKSERATTACLHKAAEAVVAVWSTGRVRVYPIQPQNIARKTKQAYEQFRRLNKTPKRQRDTKTKQVLSKENFSTSRLTSPAAIGVTLYLFGSA